MHRTDPNVICPRGYSPFDLLLGITRYSNDRVYGEKFPSDFDGHVGLTEVNTVGLNGQGYVYPVIDDQRNFVSFTELLCDASDLEELDESTSVL